MTYEEAQKILFPTTEIPNDLDYVNLKINFILNTLSENLIDYCEIFRIVSDKDFMEKFTQNQIYKKTYEVFNFFAEAEDTGKYLENNNFQRSLDIAFTAIHCGDCTAFAATCSRCFHRSRLGLPCDAPENKSIGWKALNMKKE